MKHALLISIILAAGAAGAAPTEKLEKAYWDCDYATTMGLLPFDMAADCSVVFEKLKAEKFNGDFKSFMAWWQANKTEQYARRKK